jgi:BMFP domain-containing protein YqiC
VAESATANDVQAAINDSLQAALAALDMQARTELAKVDNIVLQ